VVATNDAQFRYDLPLLHDQALSNCVDDVRILSQEDVHAMEPQLGSSVVGALFSPSTGVVDSHSLAMHLWGDAELAGTTVVFQTTVKDVVVREGGTLWLRGVTGDSDTEDNSNDEDASDDIDKNNWISCDTIINCAGLWAGELAAKIHNNNEATPTTLGVWKPPTYYFAKGTYFRLEGKSPFQHLIYPIPEPGGLGVHATIDWGGTGVKFGPDVEWLPPDTVPEEICYDPDPSRGDKFYAAIRQYWPDLPDGKLSVDFAGVRPKLSHPSSSTNAGKSLFNDFCIVTSDTHGIPGLIHLFGIESPGLTSSMAIANHVALLCASASTRNSR
jgi:L-2-hydroxyglutarate oxidase LhgO